MATTRRDEEENMENVKIDGNKIDICLIHFAKQEFKGLKISDEDEYWK